MRKRPGGVLWMHMAGGGTEAQVSLKQELPRCLIITPDMVASSWVRDALTIR